MKQDLVEIQGAGSNRICPDTMITKLDSELRNQMIHTCIETEVQEEQCQEDVDQGVSITEEQTW